MGKQILIYDTTLRDGGQGEKISFSPIDKIRIAKKLDSLGIHYIEGGYPGSNPKDLEFFNAMKSEKFLHAKLVAFGATCKPNIPVEKSDDLNAIIKSGVKVACIYGKSWDKHVRLMPRSSLQKNCEIIKMSVAYLKKHGLEVHYDAEHFFQGYINNSDYALKTIEEAIDGGSDYIVLCDTNGDCMPQEIHEIFRYVTKKFPKTKFGIHAHNDSGLAIANSQEALRAGAVIVQGTINGYGERCGNADLITIIPNLQLKLGYDCGFDLTKLKGLSLFLDECANRSPFEGRPYVGDSAFAHKGGAHVYFVKKDPTTYEHIDPSLIGNQRRILISEVSGKSNLDVKAKELGINLSPDQLPSLLAAVKEKERLGMDLETADASFSLLAQKQIQGDSYKAPFNLKSFRVTIVKEGEQPCSSEATICLEIDGKDIFRGARGKGPVNALEKAFLKAIGKIKKMDFVSLRNFKVRVANGLVSTDAQVKVSTTFGDSNSTWDTIGVSEDIIEACWQAISDAIEYRLTK